MSSRKIVSFCVLLLLFSAAIVHAKRCATSLRDSKSSISHTPQPYRTPYRVPVPLPDNQPHIYQKDHFRVLWGDGYDHFDPDWADSDNDDIPDWIEVLGDTLEQSYGTLVNMGFSPPYGVDQYYIDAYVANTGVIIEGKNITLTSDFYGYTDIDKQYDVAYFIFNDDFSIHTSNELGVLMVTAVHELFHAIQRVDYPWDDEVAIPDQRWNQEMWWFEATATWLEEVVEPGVDDHIQYIQKFLEHPARSLTYANGEREYGAAIFPGYLWQQHGGASAWQEILVNINSLGVEQAINQYLTSKGTNFIETVASFWSLAGHPEDIWPDGELFYPTDRTALYQQINTLPIDIQTSTTTAPEHLGANLFRLSTATTAASISLSNSSPESSFDLASSLISRTDVTTLTLQQNLPAALSTNPIQGSSIAIVNISGITGTQPYDLQINDISPILAGDINRNNVIELQDLLVALRSVAGFELELDDYMETAIDNDQAIGIAEAIYIMQTLSDQRTEN